MANERIRVGLIGLGEVVQTLHLPTLQRLDDLFAVVAVCDASARARGEVAVRWRITDVIDDPATLLARADIEAVLIATPDPLHCELVLAALAAGKHVMIEKPMCVTLSEAERIVSAAAASDRVVQVGYMRNYSPALRRAKGDLAALGEVRFARVTDIIGNNRQVTDQLARIVRGADIEPTQVEAMNALRTAQIDEALGPGHAPETALAYRILLGLGSHDLSALNQLFGQPRGVAHASCSGGGKYISAVLDYGTFRCHFSIGVDRIPRYDTSIEIYTDSAVLKIAYDTPYVAHLPQVLHTVTAIEDGRGLKRQASQFDWGDAFEAEWRAFHESVRQGAPVLNTVAGAYDDMRLSAAIIARF